MIVERPEISPSPDDPGLTRLAADASSDVSGVTLAVLAGGASTRMGTPKGHLRIGDEPILRYLLARFEWPGPTLLVTAPGREHPPGWEAFGREIVDPVSGLGPLRGVQTALEVAATEEILITTVDMPALGAEELRWLAAEFRARRRLRSQLAGLMTDRPCGPGAPGGARQLEPFPAALDRQSAGVIGERLRQGLLSVRDLAAQPDFEVVPSPREWGERCWVNLNRPQDLEAFLRDREQPASPQGPDAGARGAGARNGSL
jgi:molybdopterin-guanine dinucleotide biosynthesis protein A